MSPLVCILACFATLAAVNPQVTAKPIQAFSFLLPKVPVWGGMALCAALVVTLRTRRERLGVSLFDGLLAGYFLVGCLSALVNGAHWSTAGMWLATEGAALVLVLTASHAAARPWGLRFLGIGFVLCAGVLAIVALLECQGFSLVPEISRRPVALLGNRNAVAGYCSVVLPLALWAAYHKPHGVWPPLLVSALVAVILLCRTRGAWLALLVSAFVGATLFLWRLWRRQVSWKQHGAGLSACAVAMLLGLCLAVFVPWKGLNWMEPAPFASSWGRLLELDAGTGLDRVQQYKMGKAMLAENPLLGVGPGQWRRMAPAFTYATDGFPNRFATNLTTPNSDFLRIAVELGGLGLAIILAAGLVLGWSSVRELRGGGEDVAVVDRQLRLAMTCSLMILGLICLSDAALFRPPMLALAACLAGCLRPRVPRRVLARSRWTLAPLILCLGIWAAALSGVKYMATERLYARFTVETLRSTWGLFPLPFEASSLLGHLRWDTETCRRFGPELEDLVDFHPHDTFFLARSSRCAELLGERDKARALIVRALRLDPGDEDLMRVAARLSVKQ